MFPPRSPSIPVLLCVLAFAACGGGSVYEGEGVVEDLAREAGQILIDHEEIPGLMPAMTMNFDVADPALLDEVAVGQRIAFDVEFTGRAYRVVALRVLEAGAGAGGGRFAALAARADPAPDFTLTDQDGRSVSLTDWRGRVVLLDFIYTQCPGPCPVQTGLHVEVQRGLPATLRPRVRFASVSIDPERDTPEALAAYARARGADLAGWSFLTGPPERVAEVMRGFGVGASPAEDGEIDHLVVSFLIDGQGRILRRYLGSREPADARLRDLVELVERVELHGATGGVAG